MTTDQLVCATKGVSHKYGHRSALEDISFELRPRSVVGLVGANGSGKSTLLRVLAGVQRPTSGEVMQFGQSLRASETAGRGVGAAIDGMALWPSWSVRRNIGYLAHLAGAPESAVEEALELVDVASESRTKLRKLSLGNRQRVLLAAAIVTGTRLVLLDEPMNGLDPEARQRVREVILRLVRQGRSVVMSSHDLKDVEAICDDLLILHQGQLAYDGPTSGYADDSRRLTLRVGPSESARARLALDDAGIACSRDGYGNPVVAESDALSADQVLRAAGVPVLSVESRASTLEEKFHDHV